VLVVESFPALEIKARKIRRTTNEAASSFYQQMGLTQFGRNHLFVCSYTKNYAERSMLGQNNDDDVT